MFDDYDFTPYFQLAVARKHGLSVIFMMALTRINSDRS